MGDRQPRDRPAGALRWGHEERRLVAAYIRRGEVNFTRLNSARYMQELKICEPIWDRHSQRNFNQNMRRACAAYAVEEDRAGARRRNQDGGAEDDEDDDDDDYGASF